MKYILLIVILIMSSCSSNNNSIEKEVINLTNEYLKTWETLDVEKIAAFHSDENLIYYWHGELASKSNDHFRQLFTDILSSTREWSIKTSKPVVQVINEHAAIISFIGEAESTEKNGTKSKETGASTYVWMKNDGKWKIVHIHESAK